MISKTDLQGMKPFMTRKEIEVFEEVLLRKARSAVGTFDVLEWGCGGSTVYYTQFLRDHDIKYSWTSLEYNKFWWDRVSFATEDDASTKILLFDVGNTKLRQKNTNMDEYIAYPSTLGTKFDFILVDGRKRRRCLLEAANLMKPQGVTVLHDSQRKYYHCSFEAFREGTFVVGTKLWIGGN